MDARGRSAKGKAVMSTMRLWEVEVKATVYVVAASGDDAERIACYQVENDWLEGAAFSTPVEPMQIDHDWRDMPPLCAHGEPESMETCREIAEREVLAREIAKRQLILPGVKL